MGAVMVHRVKFSGIGIDTARPVDEVGARVDAAPEGQSDARELLGSRIALGMGTQSARDEILGLELTGGGHQIPASPSAAQLIERSECSRQPIGVVVGRGCGGYQ